MSYNNPHQRGFLFGGVSVNLKQAMQNDINKVFLNNNEFADTYNINGKQITGILSFVNFDKHLERTAKDYSEGITVQGANFTCASSEFKREPIRGEKWVINGDSFTVDKVIPNNGMHTVQLIRNIGR